VLSATNTLNAYNTWGGRSKYAPGDHGVAKLSFQRPNPLSAPVDVFPPGENGYGMPEFWVLNWMQNQGFAADVYTDADFDAGIPEPLSYSALILNAHPEYWTELMRDQLDAFLQGGGNLVYLGGNGLFERCTTLDSGTSLQYFGGVPPGREPNFFRNGDSPRPERNVLGVAYLFPYPDPFGPAAPYQVVDAGHRFFRGTGLENGDLFGLTGRNGAASGWETDSSIPGTLLPDGMDVSADRDSAIEFAVACRWPERQHSRPHGVLPASWRWNRLFGGIPQFYWGAGRRSNRPANRGQRAGGVPRPFKRD
jgi:hypothetical protein